MHKFQLNWLVPAALLSSDRILNHMLSSSTSGNIKELDWANQYNMALRDYQCFLPGRLRKEDIHLALSQWTDMKSQPNHLFTLNRLRNNYISWRGDHFEVECQELESWLTLISQIDPAWVIGAGYSELLDGGVLGVEQVVKLAREQCPNALPKRFDGQPIADNHVHLGGHGHYSLSLASFALHLKAKPTEVTSDKWPYRQEHSLFNSGACDLTELPVLFHRLFGLIQSSVNGGEYAAEEYGWDSLAIHQIHPLASEIKLHPSTNQVYRLLAAATRECGPASWLLISTACMLILRNSTSHSQIALVQSYIQAASILRNYMVVSGTGLGDFVQYFGFDYRKPQDGLDYVSHSQFYDLFEQHSREFRVAKETPRYFIDTAKTILAQGAEDQIHFVYHFTRGFPKHKQNDRRYTIARKNTAKSVRRIQRFFGSVAYSDYSIPNISFPSNQRVDLRTMLRGFDVAGNENELPIEVFSPALRVLRGAIHSITSPLETRLRQPFLTLHAGEDYSHLLSGLRAIDEAVTFCDYKPGDRVGHGLALGVNVYNWAERQQHIYLPLQEHLDNLVWCYQKGIELIASHPQFQAAVLMVGEKIRYFCNELHSEEFSAQTLYQAWLLRQNCPLKAQEQAEILGAEWQLWVPDIDYINESITSRNKGNLANSYNLWLQYLNRKQHNKDHEKIVSISCLSQGYKCNKNRLEDTLTLSELELFQAIQDLMLEQFSISQWVLEACPTSNIYIGRLQSYKEHPIFRWAPPNKEDLHAGGNANRFGIRRGPVRVCINTDDAGLMPTTLENEHRVIKECAINSYKVSDQDASLWIDSIRQTGVDLFRSNHLKWNQ